MLFEKQIIGFYKQGLFTRCDDTGLTHYFSHDDFPDMAYRPYYFKSSMGHTLRGYFYWYPQPKPGRLIVFDHGFGGGHRAYMKEINLLCKAGYTVFSYDHTGCMESEGETPNGMTQSLRDLDDCIKALRADTKYADVEISVVGHSWGGFSTLNIAGIHPDIKKIVVMAGFVSAEMLIDSYFGGVMALWRNPIIKVEREANPDYFPYNAVDTLKKANVKALLIYSEDDKMCDKSHYDALYKGLSGKGGIRFRLEQNKGHNPNYTEDAAKYLGRYQEALAKAKKKLKTPKEKEEFVKSWDWDRMTAQDNDVWQEILDFLL